MGNVVAVTCAVTIVVSLTQPLPVSLSLRLPFLLSFWKVNTAFLHFKLPNAALINSLSWIRDWKIPKVTPLLCFPCQ